MTPLKLVGGYGSPYSRKMRAVLRYRRIPFTWIMRGSPDDVGIPAVPVALIPVLVFPGEGGRADEAMIDSTFQLRRLEKMFPARSVIPPDPAIAFLDAMLEDFADEWLTKPMFHYCWKYAADIHKASRVDTKQRRRALFWNAENAAGALAKSRAAIRANVGRTRPTHANLRSLRRANETNAA